MSNTTLSDTDVTFPVLWHYWSKSQVSGLMCVCVGDGKWILPEDKGRNRKPPGWAFLIFFLSYASWASWWTNCTVTHFREMVHRSLKAVQRSRNWSSGSSLHGVTTSWERWPLQDEFNKSSIFSDLSQSFSFHFMSVLPALPVVWQAVLGKPMDTVPLGQLPKRPWCP